MFNIIICAKYQIISALYIYRTCLLSLSFLTFILLTMSISSFEEIINFLHFRFSIPFVPSFPPPPTSHLFGSFQLPSCQVYTHVHTYERVDLSLVCLSDTNSYLISGSKKVSESVSHQS